MKYDYVVDADGSGDFRTIQQAIDAAYGQEGTVDIYVKRGEYIEQLTLTDESPTPIEIKEAES